MQNQLIDIDFNVVDKCKYQTVKKRDQFPPIKENQFRNISSLNFKTCYSRKLRYQIRRFGT